MHDAAAPDGAVLQVDPARDPQRPSTRPAGDSQRDEPRSQRNNDQADQDRDDDESARPAFRRIPHPRLNVSASYHSSDTTPPATVHHNLSGHPEHQEERRGLRLTCYRWRTCIASGAARDPQRAGCEAHGDGEDRVIADDRIVRTAQLGGRPTGGTTAGAAL